MDPRNNTPTEYRVVNEIVVSHNPQHQLEPQAALNRALQYYRDSFFNYFPRYREELGNLPFSQNIVVEAPNLPKNGEEAFQRDVSSWVAEATAHQWVQGYKDLHFVFRGIREYSTTRLVAHTNVIQDFNGNINKQIPLAPNLRQEYQDILGELEPPRPKCIDLEADWEVETLHVLYDENPAKSFWPSRAIDNKYHLFRNGFNYEEPVTTESPFGTLNRVSDGLGLTPLTK